MLDVGVLSPIFGAVSLVNWALYQICAIDLNYKIMY